MQVEKRTNDTSLEIKFSGNLSFSDHSAFRSLLSDVSRDGVRSCVFDLSGLTSIDSAGLGMFMIARDEAAKNGWKLTIKSPKGRVKSLFDIARFDKLLAIEA